MSTEPSALALVAAWEQAKRELGIAQRNEIAARLALAHRLVPNPKEGTNSAPLEDGRTAKIKQPYNYKLDPAALPGVEKTFGRKLAAALFKWTPTLVVKEYRKLTKGQLYVLSSALEATPGMVSIEIKAAGEKDNAGDAD